MNEIIALNKKEIDIVAGCVEYIFSRNWGIFSLLFLELLWEALLLLR